MKLLIADDETVIRQGILAMNWQKIGVDQVFSAENGIEAKRYLEEEDIDIVVSDIKMPGFNGLELSEYLCKSSRDTLIILLTGFNEFQYAREAIRNQVFEYLLKPIKPEELLSVVQRAIGIMEQRKYKNQVVRLYEERVGAFGTTEKILHSFRDSNAQVIEILTSIARRYSQDISLNSLAEEYHFTPIYLSRLIKKETGYTFVDILTGIRLMNAVELLEEGRDKIQIVCEKTGFKDQRYFSQVFRKVFDCTPGEFRKSEEIKRYDSIIEMLELISSKRQMREGER